MQSCQILAAHAERMARASVINRRPCSAAMTMPARRNSSRSCSCRPSAARYAVLIDATYPLDRAFAEESFHEEEHHGQGIDGPAQDHRPRDARVRAWRAE